VNSAWTPSEFGCSELWSVLRKKRRVQYNSRFAYQDFLHIGTDLFVCCWLLMAMADLIINRTQMYKFL